jgi:2-oxoglutarate ferredoxin oxidoreductase subunit beta
LHVSRRNPDITYIVMDNMIYGLTKGQTSPTSLRGFKTGTTPYGSVEGPIEPVYIALVMGATFVARGFSGDPKTLEMIFTEAIKHKGFSFVDVYSPCVTFNRFNTYDWFKANSVTLNGPFPTRAEAIAKIMEVWDSGKVPLGIFYREEGTPTYEEQLVRDINLAPALQDITDKVWKEKVKRIIEEKYV